MNAIPYLTSPMTNELLKATRRLEQVTHENWTVDWERFALMCSHGVRVQHRSVLGCSPDSLRNEIGARHEKASTQLRSPGVPISGRLQRQEQLS